MKEKSTLADKTKFVTVALDSVKLTTVCRKANGEGKGKTRNRKTPSSMRVKEGRQCSCAGTVRWR